MDAERVAVEEPHLARLLFSDVRFGWVWLPMRLYLGYMWFEAGWHKFIDPKWMGSGEALLDFWSWIGLDRWLLPWLGTPWKPGHVFRVAPTGKTA